MVHNRYHSTCRNAPIDARLPLAAFFNPFYGRLDSCLIEPLPFSPSLGTRSFAFHRLHGCPFSLFVLFDSWKHRVCRLFIFLFSEGIFRFAFLCESRLSGKTGNRWPKQTGSPPRRFPPNGNVPVVPPPFFFTPSFLVPHGIV